MSPKSKIKHIKKSKLIKVAESSFEYLEKKRLLC